MQSLLAMFLLSLANFETLSNCFDIHVVCNLSCALMQIYIHSKIETFFNAFTIFYHNFFFTIGMLFNSRGTNSDRTIKPKLISANGFPLTRIFPNAWYVVF